MNAAGWQGPPGDVLGYPVPIKQFVAKGDRAVVALQHVVAFPEGCILTLHLAVRRGSLEEMAWERLLHGLTKEHPVTSTDGDLKFGVRFPDGSKATSIDHAFEGWAHPTDRPEPPMLIEAGGGSASTDRACQSDLQFWLWPLPPPGLFEFVIEWQDMGIGATAATLDGTAIARAAELALPYWP